MPPQPLVYTSLKIQRALPRNTQANQVQEAGRLSAELHPFLCSSKSNLQVFSLDLYPTPALACLHLQRIDLSFQTTLCDSLIYPSPQLQQAFPGNLRPLQTEKISHTVDFYHSLISFKYNPSISVAEYLLYLPILSVSICKGSHRPSPPNFFGHILISGPPIPVDFWWKHASQACHRSK